MKTLKKTLTAITFSTLGLAFTLGAAPIVTDWNYLVHTAFKDSNLNEATNFNNNSRWLAPITFT